MISNLIVEAHRKPVLTVLASVLVVVAGIWSFTQLKVEAYPDISDTQVVIVSQHPGHAAEEMEQQVTVPIERAMNSVPDVIARRSRTIFGLSVVELTFADGTNDYFARQVVSERLRDATLPEGVEPVLGPLTTPTGELYRYMVEGKGHDDMELRELQDWVIVPRLMQEQGVADVSTFGGLLRQYQIEVDPVALERYGTTVAQIAQAVSANNRNAGGALLDSRQQALVVRGVGLIRSVDDIANTVLRASKGAPVFIRDIGRVVIGPAPRTGIFGLDSVSGGVEGMVLMRRGENPSIVLEGIRAAVADINESRLPKGVTIRQIYNRSELIDNTLGTVSKTLLEGLAIVFLVLLFFLGSVRAALLTAIVIPLSLLFAFGCMQLMGIPASLLSLGALDFGIIVDGTLVMVEFILRRVSAAEPGSALEDHRDDVRDASLDMQRPIFFSLLILVAAYIPLFTLQRVESRLFTPMALILCAALAGAMLFTLTLVPVVASHIMRPGMKTWRNPLFSWLRERYQRDLAVALNHPWKVVGVAAIAVACAIAAGSRVGTEFLPQLDEGVIWIRANLPSGISLDESAAIAGSIRGVLRRFPEVRLVTSQSGRVDSGTDPFGPNRNEFLVALTPYSTWPAGQQKKDVVERMAKTLREEIPGADFNFTQPIIDMVTEAVTGSSADLAIIVSGPDSAQLRRYGQRALALLRTTPGAADSAIEQELDQPQLRIELDRQALARFALNVEDVQGLIELAVGGRAVSVKLEGEKRFDITVRYRPEARQDVAALSGMLVHTPDGGRVPLSQLALIRVATGATIVARRDNQRQITVRTNIRGRDQGTFVAEAQQRFAREIQLKNGYHVNWGGQFENLDRAQRRMKWILPFTILIIFGLLYWAFGSARVSGLVLMNVPFSIAGGILMLLARDINLSVSAAVGFISLFGVAVMSGVLFVSELKRQLHHSTNADLRTVVLEAAGAQLRPFLMLITVALLGMMPATLARGIGSDIQRPMASVIVGGLLSTLILAMVVMPVSFYLLCRRYGPASMGSPDSTSHPPHD